MRNDLVPKKVEIDPMVTAPPFGASYDAPVECPRGGKIVDRKSEVERPDHIEHLHDFARHGEHCATALSTR
jgi:hypothetical protein